jgi:signal peptidase I
MRPTLKDGQYLLSNRLAYRNAPPRRGDVVMFRAPDSEHAVWWRSTALVKRIVAVPGDVVGMRDGALIVNGRRVEELYVARPNAADRAGNVARRIFGWQHRIEVHQDGFDVPPVQPTLDTWGPLLIPTGHFFMLGDNRYGSYDSRHFGPVDAGAILGRARAFGRSRTFAEDTALRQP